MRDNCRLCGAETDRSFTATILNKHCVGFNKCQDCGSLQVDQPYWLEETYGTANILSLDIGAANRALSSFGLTYLISKILNVRGQVLDFGGGDGLLTRLLRDIGIDAYCFD